MTAMKLGGDVALDYDFIMELDSVRTPLLRFAQRLTGNETARDDLVQDTLLRAWSARHRFNAGTSFKAWLFRIARNSFLSGLHRRKRQVDLPEEDIARLLIVPASQEAGLHLGDLQSAIAKLPQVQAEALLAVTEGRGEYDKVAERLGIPGGTLRSRVARARATLMRLMDNRSAWQEEDVTDPSALSADRQSDVYAAWKRSGSRMIG